MGKCHAFNKRNYLCWLLQWLEIWHKTPMKRQVQIKEIESKNTNFNEKVVKVRIKEIESKCYFQISKVPF